MQCQYPNGCDRVAKVKVGDLRYCIKHYNEAKRHPERLMACNPILDGGEISYSTEDDLQYLRMQAQHLVDNLEDAHNNQSLCATTECRLSWRNKIALIKNELNKTLQASTNLERQGAMGKETHFQQKTRNELRKIGWLTYKMPGNVALPGMPDILGRAKWGGIALIEFKGGMPFTEQDALNMLTGAQRAVLTDLAIANSPAILCVGDLDQGTFVELRGLIDKSRCRILSYINIAELACQIEMWLKQWIINASAHWNGESNDQG